MRSLALAFVLCLLPRAALACERSASGARSFDLHVSPMAGMLCLYTLTLYEGSSCEPAHEVARSTEACSVTRRLAVTDDGTFVSIAAPRTARRNWTIVRVFTIGDGARSVNVTLDDIPATVPLRGVLHVSFDHGAVLFRDAEQDVRVTLTAMATRLQ